MVGRDCGSGFLPGWDLCLQAADSGGGQQAIQALKARRVAFNGRDRLFLVVWEYHYGKTDWDIDGCILDAAGRPVGDPFGADRWRL